MYIDPNQEMTPALREFVNYAAGYWAKLYWGLYGSTENEETMGIVLRRMRANEKPYAEFSRSEAGSDSITYLVDEGFLLKDTESGQGSILVAPTEKAIVGILQSAVAKFSFPACMAQTYGVSLSGTPSTPAPPHPPGP